MTLGHGGGTGGFTAYLIHFLSNDISLLVLSNHDNFNSLEQEFFAGLEAVIFSDHFNTRDLIRI